MKLRTQGKVVFVILLTAAAAMILLKVLAPEAAEDVREEVLPIVEVVSVVDESTSVVIPSQGLVEAPTETSMAAEVGGTVTWVSERFEVGQEFKKGDVLIEIDPADYASALAQMIANVADAELNLALEQGHARRAERDWKSVTDGEPPSDLALHLPQLKSAEAKLTSAKAAVEKATRDLERTKIRAPYDCRVRGTYVEIGSFVAPGARVTDVYELGGYEIRLPVSLDDYAFVDGSGVGAEVTFSATIAGNAQHWKGTIVRDEGVIDRTSRSVYLVAKIDIEDKGKFLNPGLFVKAEIAGRELENIISLPRKALYGKDLIYVVDAEDRLNFRTITVARTEQNRVLVSGNLKSGERVCITNLAAAIDKMKVKILDEKKDDAESDDDTPKKEIPEATGSESDT